MVIGFQESGGGKERVEEGGRGWRMGEGGGGWDRVEKGEGGRKRGGVKRVEEEEGQ